jgi:CHASE3 domain sensor protein
MGGIMFAWSCTNELPFPFNYYFSFLVLVFVLVVMAVASFALPRELEKPFNERAHYMQEMHHRNN